MNITLFPNSEIEVFSLPVGYTQMRDSGKPKPAVATLDIKIPVETKAQKSVRKAIPPGWGVAHFGKNTFRRGTKRRVQRLGGAIDEYASDSGLVRCFITLTCPGSSPSAIRGFSAWSGFLLHSLHNLVQKKQERDSGKKGVARLHVWELQKRGAEHVHVCYCVSRVVFEDIKKTLKEWWFKVLRRVSRRSGVDLFERDCGRGSWIDSPSVLQVKVEKVEKSVSAYLSKYFVKGLGCSLKGFGGISVPRPARLWGASRFLKSLLKEQVCVVSCLQSVVGSFSCVDEILSFLKGKGIRFSHDSWRLGMGNRIRVFFGGVATGMSEVFTELSRIASREEYEYKIQGKGFVMRKGLLAKAVRIVNSGKIRKGFADLYGDEVYKSLANWVLATPVGRFELSLTIRAVEDFDEVNMTSMAKYQTPRNPKDRTFVQLRLGLYPNMP